jgi:hypothetical protein
VLLLRRRRRHLVVAHAGRIVESKEVRALCGASCRLVDENQHCIGGSDPDRRSMNVSFSFRVQSLPCNLNVAVGSRDY